jgi:hypothetical protein
MTRHYFARETVHAQLESIDASCEPDNQFSIDMQGQREQAELSEMMGSKFKEALVLLLKSAAYARQTSGIFWEFAVEISQLHRLGLSENDLRFLVRMRLVDHASEVTSKGNCSREFQPTGDLYFTNRTCFVLTPQGFSRASMIVNAPSEVSAARSMNPSLSNFEYSSLRVPIWDTERRVLIFNDRIVKQFRWQAANQEMILSVFQEEGWPRRIDDPLAPSPALDIKRRLSDTIKCLNRKHENKLLHFHGDGSGQGIIWKTIRCQAATSARADEVA